MRINFRSLQNRNFMLFMFALAITVSAVLAVTLSQTYSHSTKQLEAQFNSSRSVLQFKLETDILTLKRGLSSAAKDFSIKTLIRRAQSDSASLVLALGNYQSRLKSDFLVAFNKTRQPIGEKTILTSIPVESYNNSMINFEYINQQLYLIAIEPVRFVESVPTPDAWLLTGINVNRLLGDELRSITNFDVSLRYQGVVRASSNKNIDLADFTKALSNIDTIFAKQTTSNQQTVPLSNSSDQASDIVVYQDYLGSAGDVPINLFFSLPSTEAHLNYENLIIQLSAAIAVILVLISFLTFSFSKSIARPLRMLASVANDIKRGSYPEINHDQSLYEVDLLSSALSEMQHAIKQRETENHQLAYYSASTDLPNRTYFTAHIKDQISQSLTQKFAVLWMDIDRFKDINDTLGHEFGDAVLKAIAQRLTKHNYQGSFWAYLEGDEYAAMIPVDDEQGAILAAKQVAHLFDEPFIVSDVALDVSTSVGVSVYPDDSTDAEQLMQYADIALYESKEKHHSVSRFVAESNKYSVVRLSLMTELKNAIEKDQLQLNYQPKIDIKTGKVVSAEALVRWRHPEHGFIFPDEFIPLAEQTGNIRYLTHWAIKQAILQHKTMQKLGFDIKMAINISAIDLTDLELPPFVAALLCEHNVAPSALIFEVTESAIMDDPEQAIVALNMLRNMGIKLSIDDFGTGYSSMEQLKRTPVDELKIDKSFILDLATNKDDLIIVKSITNLAHNLGLTIVAEGIENIESLNVLRELNVETAQGYFMSKPLEASLFEAWVMGNSGTFIAPKDY